jgi:hypothetical protein
MGTMQEDVGRQATVAGFKGTGTVVRVMGRTVEVEFAFGLVSADRSKVVIY